MKTWMKWILWGLGLMLLLTVATVSYMVATGLHGSRPVGFQTISVQDPKGPPLTVGIWYPTDAAQWPMLLGLSVQWAAAEFAGGRQDTAPGGDFARPRRRHRQPCRHRARPRLSRICRRRPDAHGRQFCRPERCGRSQMVRRPCASHLSDHRLYADALARPRVDRCVPHRHVRVFRWWHHGLDSHRRPAGLRAARAAIAPRRRNLPATSGNRAKSPCRRRTAFTGDGRIKAAVIAAPGYGFAFVPDGLSNVHVPVQLWNGTADNHVPYASNVAPVAAALGDLATVHRVPKAGHFSFLVPCGLIGPPLLCHDAKGFDRTAFHKTFNAAVAAFFEAKLAKH